MEESEIEELLGIRDNLKKSKYVLLIGISFVVTAIILASLSLQEFREEKTISNIIFLNEGESASINLFTGYPYSYISDGSLLLNSSSRILVQIGNHLELVEGTTRLDLKMAQPELTIKTLSGSSNVRYEAKYTVVMRPFLVLSIPSFFILIIGMALSFMGLFYFLISRRPSLMKKTNTIF